MKASTHSRNAFLSPSSWKYVASSRKSTVMVRFSRVWGVVLRMGQPLGRWSLQMMTHNGGKTAPLQGDHEGCRDSTTKFGGMWLNLLLQCLKARQILFVTLVNLAGRFI